MNTSYSDAFAEAANLADTKDVILNTIIVTHPSAGSISLVDDRQDLRAKLIEGGNVVTFKASSFDFKLPESSKAGTQYLNLSIPNIDGQATDFLKAIPLETTVPVSVVYRSYLAGQDEDALPENDPPILLYLTDVEINLVSIQARASFQSIINKNYPTKLYTLDEHPGLHV